MGFTLIELMVTLVIAGIILSVAAPSFVRVIDNNRVTTAVNDFSASLALAKIEAVKRNRNVKLVANGGDWEQGYEIGVDRSDPTDDDFDDADDTKLKIIEAVDGSVTIVPTPNTLTVIEFNALGGIASSTGSIVFDSTGDDICERTLTLNASGVFTMSKENEPCS
jgi:type IV fimbrial biogenesis protein FimT